MKKILQSALQRSLFLLALGVLIVLVSHDATRWLVIGSGILFVLIGGLTIISNFREETPSELAPIASGGSILFGVLLICKSEMFIQIMMYVLAGLLILVSLTQFNTLFTAHKRGVKIHTGLYIFPAVLFTFGVLCMFFWHEALALIVTLIGCGFIVYALLELCIIFFVHRLDKKSVKEDKAKEDVVEIKEEEVE